MLFLFSFPEHRLASSSAAAIFFPYSCAVLFLTSNQIVVNKNNKQHFFDQHTQDIIKIVWDQAQLLDHDKPEMVANKNRLVADFNERAAEEEELASDPGLPSSDS